MDTLQLSGRQSDRHQHRWDGVVAFDIAASLLSNNAQWVHPYLADVYANVPLSQMDTGIHDMNIDKVVCLLVLRFGGSPTRGFGVVLTAMDSCRCLAFLGNLMDGTVPLPDGFVGLEEPQILDLIQMIKPHAVGC